MFQVSLALFCGVLILFAFSVGIVANRPDIEGLLNRKLALSNSANPLPCVPHRLHIKTHTDAVSAGLLHHRMREVADSKRDARVL